MTHKDRILSIIFTILVTVFALIPIYEFKKLQLKEKNKKGSLSNFNYLLRLLRNRQK